MYHGHDIMPMIHDTLPLIYSSHECQTIEYILQRGNFIDKLSLIFQSLGVVVEGGQNIMTVIL